MANCCDAVSQQAAEVNMQNAKTNCDAFGEITRQAVIDNQVHARALQNLQVESLKDAQIIKHLAQVGLLQLGQTGATENQQTVSPASTATSEAIKAGVGVSAEQVAANISALSDVVVKWSDTMAALAAMVISQVQPKTTTGN